MSEPPSRIVVSCTANDEPFQGAFVTLRLPMWSKNQYDLLFGPSDEKGLIHISGDELARRAGEVQESFPMDYVGFPEEWSGSIGVQVVDRDGVERLRE